MSYSPTDNPFAQPPESAAPPQASNLTPAERKIYEFLYRFRDRPPRFTELLGQYLGRWLVFAFAVGVGLGVVYFIDATFAKVGSRPFDLKPYFAAGLIGGLLGIILRDYGHIRTLQKLWMIEMRVIDFARVERLLEGRPAVLLASPTVSTVSRDEPLAAIPVDDEPPSR